MEKIIISCLESRVESNRSLYARFLVGPFQDDNAMTIATALRRSLLSQVKGIAITAIHIQGVTHEFSTIVGVRESVLDLALHFQQIVLRTKADRQTKRFYSRRTKNKKGWVGDRGSRLEMAGDRLNSDQAFIGKKKATSLPETAEIGYLQVQGPAVVYANDLKLPAGIECVDPTQYIATLSTEGLLVVKFLIGEKKSSGFAKRSFATHVQNQGFCEQSEALLGVVHAKQSLTNKALHTDKEINLGDKTDFSFQKSTPVRKQNQAFFLKNSVCLRDTIFLDPVFDSVIHANYIIEKDDLFNQVRERIVLELWTNGSVHPRQALHKASLSLLSTFSIFRKVLNLDSL